MASVQTIKVSRLSPLEQNPDLTLDESSRFDLSCYPTTSLVRFVRVVVEVYDIDVRVERT